MTSLPNRTRRLRGPRSFRRRCCGVDADADADAEAADAEAAAAVVNAAGSKSSVCVVLADIVYAVSAWSRCVPRLVF